MLQNIVNWFGNIGNSFIDFFSGFDFITEYYPYYIQGTYTTLIIAALTVLMGTIIGLLFALMKISNNKLLRIIANIYIEVVRGTPTLLQVLICYYSLSGLIDFPDMVILDMDISRLIPGAIALSINSGAYVAEIIRAGITAVDKGQKEAANSLGMPNGMTMASIILPQAIKNILPALGNEFVIVIKESSILSVISIYELMGMAQRVVGVTFIPLEPLYVAMVIYLVITFTTSRIIGHFERRLSTDDKSK